MKIKTLPIRKAEKQATLSQLNTGDVFRFPNVSYEEAVSGAHDACFYMIIETTPKKAGRITCVSTDGKHTLERDDSHFVVQHEAEMLVKKAKLVEVS